MSDDAGSVAIVAALSLTALMGVAALAIDVGAMLTQQRTTQNGADAAALAIAHRCAWREVDPVAQPVACNFGQSSAVAATYFAANATSPVNSTLLVFSRTHSGRVGRVTTSGTIDEEPLFSRVLGVSGPLTVGANATARWGPVTALDTVFPLVVCGGTLPGRDVGPVTRVVEPAPVTPPNECTGAPDEPPFGWTAPDDPTACTVDVHLLPPSTHAVAAADLEPTAGTCPTAIDDLHDDIDFGSASDRTRVLLVYDPLIGLPGARPAYSLVAFEFTGAKLGGRTSHASTGSWSAACDLSDATVRCIEGTVRAHLPTTDGPIATSADMAVPGINDTTVFDVRLTD